MIIKERAVKDGREKNGFTMTFNKGGYAKDMYPDFVDL